MRRGEVLRDINQALQDVKRREENKIPKGLYLIDPRVEINAIETGKNFVLTRQMDPDSTSTRIY